MDHFALTLFSICIQAAIGVMAFVAIGKLLNKDGIFKNAMIAAAGLGIVGMIASLLHLGRPFVAFRALYQFGSSWLSREIWFTAIFLALTVIAVILTYKKPEQQENIKALIYVAALVGLADVYLMASIYSSTSVPVWQVGATFVEFYAAAITMGAILFLLLSRKEIANMSKIIALVVSGAVIVQVAVVVPAFISLGASSSSAVQSSLALLMMMPLATAIKWVFILIGTGLVLWIAKDDIAKPVTNVLLASVVLLLAGQVVGRYLFYASMVVTRIGLN